VLGIVNLKKDTYNKKIIATNKRFTCPTKKKPFKKCLKKIIKTNLPMYLKVPSHLVSLVESSFKKLKLKELNSLIPYN
jgi:hypothetical protein